MCHSVHLAPARTDEDLMLAYMAGDLPAGAEIYARYALLLTRVIAARGAPPADILQQTFLQLHRARADFKPSARLKPWLVTICINLCREHYRRRRPPADVPVESLDAPGPGSDVGIDAQRQSLRLHAALTALPEAQRECIALHWFGELSFYEVARVLGISEAAAKVRAHRGYETLRKHLGAL